MLFVIDEDSVYGLGDELGMLGLCDDDGWASVLDDLVKKTKRVGELENEESASSTQSSETCDHIVGSSNHEDTDEGIATDGMMATEVESEAIDLGIELSICVAGRRVDEGESVGSGFDLFAKERIEVEVGIENGHAVVDAMRVIREKEMAESSSSSYRSS